MGCVGGRCSRFASEVLTLLRHTQLWDVCSDQQAVDLIQGCKDPQEASDKLLQYALTCVPFALSPLALVLMLALAATARLTT